jgi:HKD family nuclease
VRNVIPSRANYLPLQSTRAAGVAEQSQGFSGWSSAFEEQVLITGAADPLLPHLKRHLANARNVDLAVAFTLRSGLELIQPYLQDLLDSGGTLRVLTGDYLGATDPDALLRLLDL